MNIIEETCQIPTLRIDERECLGDSIGKINYNFLYFLILFFRSKEAALDFHVSWIFYFEIFSCDSFVLEFKGLVAKISYFIGVA